MTSRFVRAHLAASLVLVIVTAASSYAYFHLDEYYQVLEWVWFKLGVTEAWTLPWEYGARMRPWMQPWMYLVIARALAVVGGRDVFQLALVFRLVTGLASWAALALFLRTTLPWLETDAEKRLHVRVATLTGFLPYLFVRTSSETLAMAAFTAAWALLLEGATRPATQPLQTSQTSWRVAPSRGRVVLAGALIGLAFEARFQAALLAVGLFAWLAVVARASLRTLAALALSASAVVLAGALVDRWGYGVWTFPAWTYFQANLVEGAAAMFGSEPPFAYAWLLPANVFFPIVVVLLVLAVLAWARNPRHPVTWATLPFFVVHNLLAHKEERFLFPLAIFATAFVVMALGPSAERPARAARVAAWGFARRAGALGFALAAWSTAMMALLALWPIGWNHHVRFQRHVHEALGGELHAYALPEFDLGLPAFHGAVYDVEKATPEEIARRVDAGGARAWLVADGPRPPLGPALEARAKLVWSEVPFQDSPALAGFFVAAAEAYDVHAKPPLRPIRFRGLYRLAPPPPP